MTVILVCHKCGSEYNSSSVYSKFCFRCAPQIITVTTGDTKEVVWPKASDSTE